MEMQQQNRFSFVEIQIFSCVAAGCKTAQGSMQRAVDVGY